jgi:hypothetical protein
MHDLRLPHVVYATPPRIAAPREQQRVTGEAARDIQTFHSGIRTQRQLRYAAARAVRSRRRRGEAGCKHGAVEALARATAWCRAQADA